MRVEPRLAERARLRVTRPRHQIGRRDVELLMGIVRVRAARTEHVGETLDDVDQLRVLGDPGRDRDDPADIGGARAPQHPCRRVGEAGGIEKAAACARMAWSLALGAPGAGRIPPKFFATMVSERWARLPRSLARSALIRATMAS